MRRSKNRLKDGAPNRARDQRIGGEPADGLRSVQTGVVVFANDHATKGDDGRCGNVEKERDYAQLFSFSPILLSGSISRRGAWSPDCIIPKPAGEGQGRQKKDRNDVDGSEKVVQLQEAGDQS